MRRLVLLGGLALAACGGSSHSGADAPIVGTWTATDGVCTQGYTFDGSGAIADGGGYSIGIVCPLQSGATGLQDETGNYRVVGSQVEIDTQKSTCMDALTIQRAAGPWYINFNRIDGDNLTLMFSNEIVLLQKSGAVSGSGTAQYGCFDSTGAFTLHPLAPI